MAIAAQLSDPSKGIADDGTLHPDPEEVAQCDGVYDLLMSARNSTDLRREVARDVDRDVLRLLNGAAGRALPDAAPPATSSRTAKCEVTSRTTPRPAGRSRAQRECIALVALA